MEIKLLADTMLGSLARWLRIMGYDIHFQSSYPEGAMHAFVQEGRRVLSRGQGLQRIFPNTLIIHSNRVENQVREAVQGLGLVPDRSRWFTRCLECNVPLKEATIEDGLENVPDYVLYENPAGIHHCKCCGRYFWPGTHRKRMLEKLEEWGF